MFQGTEPLAPAGAVQFRPETCRGRTALADAVSTGSSTEVATPHSLAHKTPLTATPLPAQTISPAWNPHQSPHQACPGARARPAMLQFRPPESARLQTR